MLSLLLTAADNMGIAVFFSLRASVYKQTFIHIYLTILRSDCSVSCPALLLSLHSQALGAEGTGGTSSLSARRGERRTPERGGRRLGTAKKWTGDFQRYGDPGHVSFASLGASPMTLQQSCDDHVVSWPHRI